MAGRNLSLTAEEAGGGPGGEGLQPGAGDFSLQLLLMVTVGVEWCCPVNYRLYFV